VDPPDQLAQLGERRLGLLVRGADLIGGRGFWRQIEPRQPQRHRQRDEPLLGAVV